ADVIVNSTSVDLNLDRGHVSSQINKLAGTELQKALYRKAKEINFWEYIVTSAFDLSNCKHIFHCALEPLNDNDKMRATVRLLLNEANRMSCNSIALPALGTGYLGYKPRDAATAIFLAVSDFVQFHGDRSHLEDITIVIYQTEENTFQAFKKVEAEMKPGKY
ncbi:PAR14-like protein, partial [Mya arenaria]